MQYILLPATSGIVGIHVGKGRFSATDHTNQGAGLPAPKCFCPSPCVLSLT